MANPFRDMSVIMQFLLALAITVVLVVAGVYIPFSPVAQERDELDKAGRLRGQLTQEVTQLHVYRQRYAELKSIVPEEKEADEFIRLVQGAAAASNVQLRRLTSMAIVSKEYHYEMPFDVQADGPYFNILDFFSRLSRLSRIINVGDLAFTDAQGNKGAKYPLRPGTTVSGTFTATTFFTKPADAGAAAAKPAGKP